MLLSWLDRVTLLVHPHQIVLERRNWRGASIRKSADVQPAAGGESDWQPALTAVLGLLAAEGKAGGSLRVVIADHFVRYALLPWSELLTTRAARQAMALALLRNALGERVAALEIALDRPSFGMNGLAAGIDRGLLGGLRTAAKGHRLRLNSLQPSLVAELDGRHKQLVDGWFACVDREWLALVGLRGGEISCLRNHRASTADANVLGSELGGLLAAEMAAVDGRKVQVVSRDGKLPELPGAWEVSALPAILIGAGHA